MTQTETTYTKQSSLPLPDAFSAEMTEMFTTVQPSIVQVHTEGRGAGTGIIWKIVGKDVSHMGQKQIHRCRISRGQNEGSHQTLFGSNGSVNIARLANDLARGRWPNPRRNPCSFGDADTAKASLILSHFQHGSAIFFRSCRDGRLNEGGEVFLKSSWASCLACGCLGRGTSLRQ